MILSVDEDDSDGSSEASESDIEVTSVVIDNGSDTIKVGFSGQNAPKAVFPSKVGIPTHVTANKDNYYVGDEIESKGGVLKIQRPINGGVIHDWDGMEKILHHAFSKEMSVDPEDYKVLLTDNVADDSHRQKMAEIMFETFNVPGLLVKLQSVLSLYNTGRISGVVVDSGYETTNVTPIYDGVVHEESVQRIEMGGVHINNYLRKLLNESKHYVSAVVEKGMVNDMKETICFGSSELQLEDQMKHQSWERDYQLPDGKVIQLKGEHIRAVEPLFDPSLIDIVSPGIHVALGDIIRKHPDHNHNSNIILSGGNTMFRGLEERLHKEMGRILSPAMVLKVVAALERKYSVWEGGSMYASLSGVVDKWVTSQEWEEFGGGIVKRKLPTDNSGMAF